MKFFVRFMFSDIFQHFCRFLSATSLLTSELPAPAIALVPAPEKEHTHFEFHLIDIFGAFAQHAVASFISKIHRIISFLIL